MNLFTVLTGGTGALLIYCGVKGYDPRDVVQYAFGGPPPEKITSEDQFGSDDPLMSGGKVPLDGSAPDPDDRAFPDGPDAGFDGYDPSPQSPTTFHPTVDKPPRGTSV